MDQCPDCGSKNVSIAYDVMGTHKCKQCGNVWLTEHGKKTQEKLYGSNRHGSDRFSNPPPNFYFR
jgi:rubredoxin